MCIRRSLNEGTMVHLRNGLVVVKSEKNYRINSRVNLTRKTLKSGEVRYGVTITSLDTRRNVKMQTFPGISGAWKLYKTLRTA